MINLNQSFSECFCIEHVHYTLLLICAAAVVTFDPTSYTVTEGGQVTLELTLSNPSDMEVTVNVVTREGSATSKYNMTCISNV